MVGPPRQRVQASDASRTLTFADRVAYQRAIEEVYWRHRNWPGADGSGKPSLDQLMPQAQIEKKVEDYLGNSQALEDYWQQSEDCHYGGRWINLRSKRRDRIHSAQRIAIEVTSRTRSRRFRPSAFALDAEQK